jgi:hypothetical protein
LRVERIQHRCMRKVSTGGWEIASCWAARFPTDA